MKNTKNDKSENAKRAWRGFGAQTNDLVFDPPARIWVDTGSGFKFQSLSLQRSKESDRHSIPLSDDFIAYLNKPSRFDRNAWQREVRQGGREGRLVKTIVVTSDIRGFIIFSVWNETKECDTPEEVFELSPRGLRVLFDIVDGIGGRALIEKNRDYFDQLEAAMEGKKLAEERKAEEAAARVEREKQEAEAKKLRDSQPKTPPPPPKPQVKGPAVPVTPAAIDQIAAKLGIPVEPEQAAPASEAPKTEEPTPVAESEIIQTTPTTAQEVNEVVSPSPILPDPNQAGEIILTDEEIKIS